MSGDKYDPASDGWHLDRRVPIALLLTIFITFTSNLALGVWFVSDLYHKSENNSQKINELVVQVKEIDSRSDAIERAIVELKTEVSHGNEMLQEIRRFLNATRRPR